MRSPVKRMIPSLSVPVDLLRHILTYLSLISLIHLSRVCRELHQVATSRMDDVYKLDCIFKISILYEEFLADPQPSLRRKLGMIIDGLCLDEHDALHVSECLRGDRSINSISRPLPVVCDPDLLAVVLSHSNMETPLKLTAYYFDHIPLGILQRHISQGISATEMFEVILNCKNIKAVGTLCPFLHEPQPFLLKLLETMNPADQSLSNLEPGIEGVCLACRLCHNEDQIAPILDHVTRYRHQTSTLLLCFHHLIVKKIEPALACRLYTMMPQDEDTRRTVVLAAALSGFDLTLYEAIRGCELVVLVKELIKTFCTDTEIQTGAFPIYEIVEAAIMMQADETLLLHLLSHPLLEHDADLIYTAVFRGYSEQILLAIMATPRLGWYRSSHCLFYMVPFAMDRLQLPITVEIPQPVLLGLFNDSIKSEFYFVTGPDVYSDDCYAPFLDLVLRKPCFSHIAVEMATKDRLQRMPKSLTIIWEHLVRTDQDYCITKVSPSYQVVHRRRLKLFLCDSLHNPNIVDTADTFKLCRKGL